MSVDDLIGIPFKWGGRDRSGYDCYGLVMELFRRSGVSLADYPSSTDERSNIETVIDALQKGWSETPKPKGGGIALFRNAHREATHVAFLLDKDRFIHVMEGHKVAIERLSNPVWDRRVVGFYVREMA